MEALSQLRLGMLSIEREALGFIIEREGLSIERGSRLFALQGASSGGLTTIASLDHPF